MFSFFSQETSGVDNYSEFKSKWNPDAFYPSTVLTFITEKLLPYWLQCKTCQKWRKIQNSHLKEENLIDKDLGKSITFTFKMLPLQLKGSRTNLEQVFNGHRQTLILFRLLHAKKVT